ncbi:unnamed protein product, partial [marine sediment metagenome]
PHHEYEKHCQRYSCDYLIDRPHISLEHVRPSPQIGQNVQQHLVKVCTIDPEDRDWEYRNNADGQDQQEKKEKKDGINQPSGSKQRCT